MKETLIDSLFIEIQKRFLKWLEKKPTGEFSFHININEGGIRDKPNVTIKEKI